MSLDAIPTDLYTGEIGAVPSLVTVTVDAAETYVLPPGVYYIYASAADVDFEFVTASTPTWTKFRDGGDTGPAMLVWSDGKNARFNNTGSSADQTASLIKIG